MTTVLGRYRAREMMEVLGAPSDSGWVNVCCLAFGYPLGKWATAQRVAVGGVALRNQWGAPLGPEMSGPLGPLVAEGRGYTAGTGLQIAGNPLPA